MMQSGYIFGAKFFFLFRTYLATSTLNVNVGRGDDGRYLLTCDGKFQRSDEGYRVPLRKSCRK